MTTPKIEGDRYYTPDWCVKQCMSHVLPIVRPRPDEIYWVGDDDKPSTKTILEPSAGEGAFLGPLRVRYPEAVITAIDINDAVGPWEAADHSFKAAFLELESELEADPRAFDLVIGNPPFTYALEFCQQALKIGSTVVFLVRLGFLSSAKRSAFFREHPPSDVFVMANRPSFAHGTTDKADYCWVCWSDATRRAEYTTLHWLPEVSVEERKA